MAAHFDLNGKIPHRPPWLLLDAVIDITGPVVTAQRRISADDPLVVDGLPETLMIEALAQTSACLGGQERGHHHGYLVALSQFTFQRRPVPGETLRCVTERTAVLGNLHRFKGTIHSDGELLCAGQLTFAIVASGDGGPA